MPPSEAVCRRLWPWYKAVQSAGAILETKGGGTEIDDTNSADRIGEKIGYRSPARRVSITPSLLHFLHFCWSVCTGGVCKYAWIQHT